MRRFVIGLAALAAPALAALTPARADFYTLDGRFQCLERGDAVCGDAQPLARPRPLPAAKPAAMPTVLTTPVALAPSALPSPISPQIAAPASPRSDDPLHAIAARIEARAPTSNDLAWLKQVAQAGNPRAIELLAWCKLNALGAPRDAVEAYLLYGAAASAGLPHARDNQALIYERDLASDQRQQVLDLINEGVALAQVTPAAR